MRHAPSLWEQFQALEPMAEASGVVAIPCGSGKQHLLVRGDRGEPALLLATETRPTPRADIRLKHVGVQFDRRFEVAHSDNGGTEVGNFCRFICEPSGSHLHQYFVELMAATASTHPGRLSAQATDEVVDVLLELFRKLSIPPSHSVTGLWGELLLMHLAASPGKFLDAWHLRATDGFDFAFVDKRIEVKTTQRPSREHDFSLQQVRSGRETDFVASIILARSSAGLSVLDLARLVAERLDAARQAKLWHIVIETLGEDPDSDGDQRFDAKAASDKLVFVRASDVPAPEVSDSVVAYVTDVRFRSNISALCMSAALNQRVLLGE